MGTITVFATLCFLGVQGYDYGPLYDLLRDNLIPNSERTFIRNIIATSQDIINLETDWGKLMTETQRMVEKVANLEPRLTNFLSNTLLAVPHVNNLNPRQKGAPVEKDYLTYTIEEASWERLEMTYNIIKPETAALKIEKDKTNKTLIGIKKKMDELLADVKTHETKLDDIIKNVAALQPSQKRQKQASQHAVISKIVETWGALNEIGKKVTLLEGTKDHLNGILSALDTRRNAQDQKFVIIGDKIQQMEKKIENLQRRTRTSAPTTTPSS